MIVSLMLAVSLLVPPGEGERIAFLGDSITHGGAYVSWLQLCRYLRHPGSKTVFINAGLGGDTARGGADRFWWNLEPERPDRVVIAFGMNDVGGDLWHQKGRDAERKRDERFSNYRKSLTLLSDWSSARGWGPVLMTPFAYDEYGADYPAAKSHVGRDSRGLAMFAGFVRTLAAERNFGLIDIHAPHAKILSGLPGVRLSDDRVHPNRVGHVILAAEVLMAFGETGVVARTELTASGRICVCENASVSDVRASRGGLSFTYHPKALPFPVVQGVTDVAAGVSPLVSALNQEHLVVRGLRSGTYDLMAGGRSIGSYSSADFAGGVNLAGLETPGQLQAQCAYSVFDCYVRSQSDWQYRCHELRKIYLAGGNLQAHKLGKPILAHREEIERGRERMRDLARPRVYRVEIMPRKR